MLSIVKYEQYRAAKVAPTESRKSRGSELRPLPRHITTPSGKGSFGDWARVVGKNPTIINRMTKTKDNWIFIVMFTLMKFANQNQDA